MTETKTTGSKTSRKDRKSSTEKANKPLTKVVVRRLPPTMTAETFLEQIQPVPDHDHMYFVPADWTLSVNATCRAYFNFLKMEDVFIFKEKFHGYIFVDSKGNEYPAIVEFAPYQRIGRTRSKKVDRKCNTYETSEHYLEFIRTMDTEEALPKLELKSDFDAKHDNQIRSTPLLEFLNDKKSRKRDRDRKQPQDRKKILAPIKEDLGKENSRHQQRQDKQRTGQHQQQAKDKDKDGEGSTKRERPERSEKEKARRAERDKMRREKRQQQVVEKKKERELQKQQKPNEAKDMQGDVPTMPSSDKPVKPSVTSTDDTKKPGREAKKYSERRQENRSKQASSGKRSEDAVGKPQQSTRDPVERKSSETSSDKPSEGGEKKKESRRYSERRVRNKDRPAIQIYQPGSSGSSSKGKRAGEGNAE